MKYLYGTVVLIVIAIGVLAANDSLPSFIQQLYRFRYGDKVLHFLLIGSCNGALILLAHQGRNISLKRVLCITCITLTIATVEEFSQKAFPHRTFSYKDLIANYMGILSFAALIMGSAFIIKAKKAGKSCSSAA